MRKKVDQPKVSVVIPTYNRASVLRRCLDSLRKQTVEDFEVLICDDGSTDETMEVTKEYSTFLDITYDYAENFGGPSRPRNRGINLARAPYVAFLDSDDWWMPQKLQESLKYLEKGADLVYHNLSHVKKHGQRFFWREVHTRELKKPVYSDLIKNGNAITNSSVVLRKDILCEVNGISEDRELISVEDFDAWLRIAELTEKFKRIPQTLGYYWGGGDNISNPERTLSCLNAIEARYINTVSGRSIDAAFYWLCYARGRAYYHLGSYAMAVKHLSSIRWQQVPFSIYVKSQCTLLLIRIYNLLVSGKKN